MFLTGDDLTIISGSAHSLHPSSISRCSRPTGMAYKRFGYWMWATSSLLNTRPDSNKLKQNFPLHFFYGDSVNAIQIQTWMVLIANLLITVFSRSIKRQCAFSQVVTMVRMTLMYDTFMENSDKNWEEIQERVAGQPHPEPFFFDWGAWKRKTDRNPYK